MQRSGISPDALLIQEYCIHRDDFNTFGGNRHALDDFIRYYTASACRIPLYYQLA